MPAYDAQRLADLAERCDLAVSNREKELSLHDLAEYVFDVSDDFQLFSRRALDVDRSQEVDLRYLNRSGLQLGLYLSIECRNRITKVTSSDVRDFAAKLRPHAAWIGIFISREPFTGKANPASSARYEVIRQRQTANLYVINLTIAEIVALQSSEELLDTILRRVSDLIPY